MNTEQFTAYIYCGLGRPYLYLQQHDSTPYHDALLHACIYNPVYDRQCVGSRATYLSGLIALAHQEDWFEQRIIDAFAIFDAMDHEQLFDFALMYARAGNTQARRLMYEHFSAWAGDGTNVGAIQLIDLDGIDGFRFVAARLGEAALLDPDFWDSDYLILHLKERVPSATIDDDIAALGIADISLQRYLNIVAETEASRQQASQQRQSRLYQSYAQLKI